MFLATTKVEDFDRWWSVFSTTSLEKRKQHGSKGSHVFRDPNEEGRVWVLFDWDMEGWENYLSDPFKKPGTQVGHRLRSSPASSTASPRPRGGGECPQPHVHTGATSHRALWTLRTAPEHQGRAGCALRRRGTPCAEAADGSTSTYSPVTAQDAWGSFVSPEDTDTPTLIPSPAHHAVPTSRRSGRRE
jgi:hypothetical protein